MNRYIALQKIVELGSFSKAAEALGYTQSALSQMIASLEEEMKLQLLHRSRTGATLTMEGEELYPFIEKTIYRYKTVEEKAKEIRGLESGTIRIGTLSSISTHWMPTLLKEFKEQYPKVDFVIHEGDYKSIQEWIKKGAVDFGFVSPNAVNGIAIDVLKKAPMLAILPENHRLASQKIVKLEDLAKEPYILLEEGNYYEPVEAFHSVGLEPDIKYTIHNDNTIMTMVEAGFGVSILAELALHRTDYRIVLKKTEPPVTRTLAIGCKSIKSLSMASKKFIMYMKSKIEELP